MSDWYRKENWNKEIEEEYFKKLARARETSRAQYLKIQAIHLVETKQSTLLTAAEMLIRKLLNDYPDNRIDRSVSLSLLGDICLLRQETELALGYYKEALDHEQIFPNVITNVWLEFSELVIKLKKVDLYQFAKEVILQRIENSPFPVVNYKGHLFLSVIAFREGDSKIGLEHADLADHYTALETSGLHYHKYTGVVEEPEKWLENLIAYYRRNAPLS